MSFLSMIAFVSGVAGVWLTVKTNIWCWPAALLSVVASAAEFFQQHLFGDMCLQGVYFVAGLYGWYFWNSRPKNTFEIEKTPKKFLLPLIAVTVLQGLLYFWLLLRFRGDRPFLDATLTAASLTATFMMTRKWIENWLAWVVIDLFYVVLYFMKGMVLFAFLYFLFAAMAYYGWKKWAAEALKK